MITPVSHYQHNAPSFTSHDSNKFYNRVTDAFTDKIAHAMAKMQSKENPGALINWVNSHPKLNKYSHQIMLNLSSLAYTGMLIGNTAKSKKIEKDRKPMLILNAALVTAVSSVAAFIVDKKTDGFLEKINTAYKNSHRFANKDTLEQFESSLKKVKSIALFTGIVRLAIPLLMVPITGSIVKNGKAKRDAQKAAEEAEKFRRANPKLMENYDRLKALSAQFESKAAN